MKWFKLTCMASTGPTQRVTRLPVWHKLPWPLRSIPGTATLLAGGPQPFPGSRRNCIMETHNLQQNRSTPVPPTHPTTWTRMERLTWMTVMIVSTTHHLEFGIIQRNRKIEHESVDIRHRFYSYNLYYTVSPAGNEPQQSWFRVSPVQLRHLVFSERNAREIKDFAVM